MSRPPRGDAATRRAAARRPFAAVIVLHRSRDHLAALLASDFAPAQLIVVDTGPDDGGADLARAHGARVLLRRDNPGFGAANNEALQHVTQPLTVLVNADVIAHEGALERLAARLQPRELHVPRLLNADGTTQRSAHPLPGTVGAFLPALVHPPLLPAPLRDRAEPYRAHRSRTVGWAVAACLAAETATLRALGPFDPAIHLFAEDMDLCLRARDAGIPTLYHPDIAVTHTGRHSVRDEPFELLAAQRRTVIGRTRGWRARALDDAAQAITFAARALVKRPNERERAQLDALLKAARPGSKPGPRR